jgi:hypothetical protein
MSGRYTPGYLRIVRWETGEHRAWCVICHTKKRAKAGGKLCASDHEGLTWYREHAATDGHLRRRREDIDDRYGGHAFDRDTRETLAAIFGPPEARPRQHGPRR